MLMEHPDHPDHRVQLMLDPPFLSDLTASPTLVKLKSCYEIDYFWDKNYEILCPNNTCFFPPILKSSDGGQTKEMQEDDK